MNHAKLIKDIMSFAAAAVSALADGNISPAEGTRLVRLGAAVVADLEKAMNKRRNTGEDADAAER